MKAAYSDQQPLRADFYPLVGESDVGTVVGRVLDVALTMSPDVEPATEAGPVTVEVVEQIAWPEPPPPARLRLDARRLADPELRDRSGFDQWNSLSLMPGSVLLLSCRPRGDACQALAAADVEFARDPLVTAIKQAYAIERFTGPIEQRQAMILYALESPQPQLQYYAFDLLGRRSLYGREVGARLISRALLAGRADPPTALELGDALSDMAFFDPERGADPVNAAIVATLARRLAASTDPEGLSDWASMLRSCVMDEFADDPKQDREARIALLRAAAQGVDSARVIAALDGAIATAEPDEQADLEALRDLWRKASGVRAP